MPRLFHLNSMYNKPVMAVGVNGCINHDFPEPWFKWPGEVKGLYVFEDLHKSIVQNLSGFFTVIGIRKADTHSIGIEILIEQFLALAVILLAPDQNRSYVIALVFQIAAIRINHTTLLTQWLPPQTNYPEKNPSSGVSCA